MERKHVTIVPVLNAKKKKKKSRSRGTSRGSRGSKRSRRSGSRKSSGKRRKSKSKRRARSASTKGRRSKSRSRSRSKKRSKSLGAKRSRSRSRSRGKRRSRSGRRRSKTKRGSRSRSRSRSSSKGRRRSKSRSKSRSRSRSRSKSPKGAKGGRSKSPRGRSRRNSRSRRTTSSSSSTGSDSDDDSSDPPSGNGGPPKPPPMPPGPVKPFKAPVVDHKEALGKSARERGIWNPDVQAHVAQVQFPASKRTFRESTIQGVIYPTQQGVARPDLMVVGIPYAPVYQGPIELKAQKVRLYIRKDKEAVEFTEIIVPSEKYMYWPHVRPGQEIPAKYREMTDKNLHGLDRTQPLRLHIDSKDYATERDMIAHKAMPFDDPVKKPKKWPGFEQRTKPSGGKAKLNPVMVPPDLAEEDEGDDEDSSGSSSSGSSSPPSPSASFGPTYTGPSDPFNYEETRNPSSHLRVRRVSGPQTGYMGADPGFRQRQGQPQYTPLRRSQSVGQLTREQQQDLDYENDPRPQWPPQQQQLGYAGESGQFASTATVPPPQQQQQPPQAGGGKQGGFFNRMLRRNQSDSNLESRSRSDSSASSASSDSSGEKKPKFFDRFRKK